MELVNQNNQKFKCYAWAGLWGDKLASIASSKSSADLVKWLNQTLCIFYEPGNLKENLRFANSAMWIAGKVYAEAIESNNLNE